MAASLDPEEVYSFLRPTMASLQRIVEEFGGTVPQVMGDGFMAVFGVPVAHEDDAERAVRSAIALRDHVRELNADQPEVPFPEVHAGVNSGEVMVAPADEQAGFRVVGNTVNVASRLADLATAGKVLVDQHTHDLTSHAVSYGPRRGKRAKGLARPLSTYEVLDVRPHLPRPRRAGEGEGAFVNREVETARLEAELRAVRRRPRCRVQVITGEPGLGKTRLAEEFARRSWPARVLTGRCRPFGQRRPLDALGEALSVEILGSGPRDVDASKAVLERIAGRIGDPTERAGVARDLGILLGLERPRGRRPDAIEGVVRAARGIVEDLAKQGPILLILDDLHWADPELLDVVRDAHSTPWKGPILVLGVSRPEGMGDVFPRLDLSALDESGSRALAEDVLGSDLPSDLIRSLVARSGGNPLFLEESVGMLVDSGAIAEEGGRWRVRRPHEFERVPSAIRRLIAARLDALPPAEKRLLQDASVAGDAVWDGLLEDLFEGSGCRPTLRSVEARDLLRRRRPSVISGTAEYRFKHVLIREVAYDSLPKAERARTHLAIARWLLEDARHDDPALVAHHYESAWRMLNTRTGPPPSPEVATLAVRYLRRHADESFAYQARTAEALYARALRVAETSGSGVDDAEHAALLIGRSEALEEMGRRREAIEQATRAHDYARRSGERELQARALLARGRSEGSRPLLHRSLALFEEAGDLGGQGWAHLGLSETWADEDYGLVVAYQVQAYELLSKAGQIVGRSLVAQSLAYLLTVVGGPEFDRWYETCKRQATNEGDLRSRAELLRTRGYFEHYRGRHGEAIRLMQEARPIAVEAGDRYTEADTLVIEATATACVGPPERAQDLAVATIHLGREMESDRVVALGMLAGTRAAIRSGRSALAVRRLRAAVKLLQPPTRPDTLDAHLVTAQTHLDRGAWGDVAAAADELRTGVLANGWRLWEPLAPLLTGQAHLAAAEPGRALADLERAVSTARSTGATGTLPIARAALSQAMILSGRQPRPHRLDPAPHGDLAAIEGENRGLLALRTGDASASAEAFGEAIGHWQRLGVTAMLARAHAMHAASERRAGRPRPARRSARRAVEILDLLGTREGSRGPLLDPLDRSSSD